VPVDRVYRFDQNVQAHAAIEAKQTTGKIVVTT